MKAMFAGYFEAANRLAGYECDPIFVTLCTITRAERLICREALITCALFNGAVSCRDYIQCWQKSNGIARSISVTKRTGKSEIFENKAHLSATLPNATVIRAGLGSNSGQQPHTQDEGGDRFNFTTSPEPPATHPL
jgi:hypothetical protein